MRVLVVEDDPVASNLLIQILEGDGYQVAVVGDGLAALEEVSRFRPHAALIDGNLPGLPGREVARRLRQSSDLPIMFVTAADAVADRRAGFAVGGDDYVVKPFDPEELSWRVRAILRRAGHALAQVWVIGDLVVDEPAHQVSRAGAGVSLTAVEFSLLVALLRRRGRVVPKTQLLDDVWGYQDQDDNVVEVHMCSLRHKLEAHGPRIIETVRSRGYVLRP
ncbi:MAG TPA: response regulator transcription factor [Acidimicrobiales bacterium]